MVAALGAAALWALAGCSDDSAPQPDGAGGRDAGQTDLPAGCSPVDGAAATESRGGYLAVGAVKVSFAELLFAADPSTGTFAMLRIEDFHLERSYPKTAQVTGAVRTFDCDLCATIGDGCTGDFSSCARVRFAQRGTIEVALSDQGGQGRMQGSVSDLVLVEWDEDRDRGRAGGDCASVGSASFDVSW